MAKQTKHIERCISAMEMSAKCYRQKEAEYKQAYEKAGPGSYFFDLMMQERAAAHAYENCLEMLRNPDYFTAKATEPRG